MAIPTLDDKLNSMLGEQKPVGDLPTVTDIAQSQGIEGEMTPEEQYRSSLVAGPGFLDNLVTAGKVIKQGVKSSSELSDIANKNANAIEIIREQQLAAAEAAKKAAAAEKARQTRAQKKAAKDQEPAATEPTETVAPVAAVDSPTVVDVPAEAAVITKIDPIIKQDVPADEAAAAAHQLETTARQEKIFGVASAEKVKAFLSGELPEDAEFDISFKNIKDPEDLDYVTKKTLEVFQGDIYAAKRGVVSDQEVADMASRMNMSEDLLKRDIGTVYNAEQLKAANMVVVASGRKLNQMIKQIKELGAAGKEDAALLVDFTNHLNVHAAYMMNFKAAKSEAARALRASRTFTDDADNIDINALQNHIAELGGPENIKNMAAMVDTLDEAQKAVFIQKAGFNAENFSRVWKEVWQSALISAPASVERSLFGAALLTFMRPVDTLFGATLGKVDVPILRPAAKADEAEDFASMSDAAIELANFFTSIPNGLKAGAQAWRTDAPVYGAGKNIDTSPDPAITSRLFQDPNTPLAQATDYVGKMIRLPFRGMLFVDEATKAVVAQMELKKLAGRDALLSIKNGMDPDDAMLMMAKEVADPSPETISRIDTAVQQATLQTDLGALGKWVMKTRSQLDQLPLPVGSILAPYVKTVINAEKELLSRTPFAPLMQEVRDELMAGGARRQVALGKIYSGASIMGAAFMLAAEGRVTGLGPADPKMRQWLKENEGWQECSIVTGDIKNNINVQYHSIAGLEPIGGLVCSAATIAELGVVYGKDDDASFGDLLLYSALLPFKYIAQLPMADQLGRFFEMVQEVNRDSKGERTGEVMNKFFGGFTKNLVGGVVPFPMPYSGLLRQMERTMDPTTREVTLDASLPTETKFFDFGFRSWLAGTPLGSTATKEKNGEQTAILEPKRNYWGEEVTAGRIGLEHWLFPFFSKDSKNDALSQQIREISVKRGKMILNPTDRTIENIKLNDNEFSFLQLTMNQIQIEGKTLRMQLTADLAKHSQEIAEQRYAGVASTLSSTSSAFKKAAYQSPQFKARYPEVSAQIMANQIKADLHIDKIKREPQE